MNIQCSGSSRSFAKETRVLKIRSIVGRHRKWTMDNWERWSSYDYRSCWRFHVDHFMVIWYFKQIGKVKKFDKWISHELTKNQQKLSFWTVFSYSLQQQRTISQLDCDVWWKVDYIPNWWRPAQWLGREKLQGTSPNQTCAKNRSWSLFGGLPASLIFLNPGKTITSEKQAQQIDEMHQKLQGLQPALVNRMGPVLLHDSILVGLHQQLFKSWTNWTMKFCPTCHIHLTSQQPTSASSSI